MPSTPINFSPVELAKFRAVHDRFWPLVVPQMELNPPWGLSDDGVVQRLVMQVAVIGNSGGADRLLGSAEAKRNLRWSGHLDGKDRKARIRSIHIALKQAGVRWAGKTIERCQYSPRLADSLAEMEREGGPRAFIASLGRIGDENARLARAQELPVLRGSKSSRDFLSTGFRLANSKVALDLRVLAVLREIAPGKIIDDNTPPRSRYLSIERALIEQVCIHLGCSGFELDQLFYRGQGKNGNIVRFLSTGSMPAATGHADARCI